MQVMWDEATKLFKPKGFSKTEDADAHQEAEDEDEVLDEAHRSTWGGVFLISPHPTDENFTCSTGRRVSPRIWRATRWPSKAPSIHTINICPPRRN